MRHRDDAVLDEPILSDQHDEGATRAEMDKFDVLQRTILVGDDDDPGAMRQARQRGRRLLERLRQALAACQTKALYAAAFIFGKTPDLEQPMNEEAKPQLGRQSAGR